MFNNISNCEIIVNNYSNSPPVPNNNNNNNDNKRKSSRPLESFGFKRQSVENSVESIVNSNWDVVNGENKKQEENNTNNNNNNNGNNNIKDNNVNMRITMENQQITIKPKGNRMDWLVFPHLIKIIHKYTQEFNFNYRKAADYCNFHYRELFLDYPISFATIQTWYIDNPELNSKSRSYLNISSKLQPKKVLKPAIFDLLQRFESNLKHEKAGRPRIFAKHVHLETEICNMIAIQRKRGTPINSVVAQSLILGILRAHKFEKLKEFGGTFKCSRRWVRDFLVEYCWLSYRRSTNAAQKLPDNAEIQCESMVERIANLAAKYSIPADLLVNCDQTGLHYLPKSRYTYEMKGAINVSVVGEEDKRQFTAVVGVSASNEILPIQLIYPGKPTSTRALPDIEYRKCLEKEGFQFSQTITHWSNVETTKLYISTIIQPYFKRTIEKLNLDLDNQHCILLVDVWHRDKNFLQFMKEEYPRIKLVFVPAGCTGIAQPCDVFIQRPFKHAVLTEFNNWAVDCVKNQMDAGAAAIDINLDVTAKNLRNIGCKWILNSWNQLKIMKSTMEKGWIKCKIMPRAFETVFQLQSRVKWLEQKYDCDEIHIPMGNNREIPVTDNEQHDSHLGEGEDELETTEQVAAECVNDEEIAEILQMYEEEDY